MKKRRDILIELGVVLNFPLAIWGTIGVFVTDDMGLGFSIWMAFAAFYNIVVYFLLGQRLGKLQDEFGSQPPPIAE